MPATSAGMTARERFIFIGTRYSDVSGPIPDFAALNPGYNDGRYHTGGALPTVSGAGCGSGAGLRLGNVSSHLMMEL
jgi:hypothetical protein